MQTKIEKLARQISVLETSVTENKTAAEIKEKAVSETKISMLQVTRILVLTRVLTLDTCVDTCVGGDVDTCVAGVRGQDLPGHVSHGGLRVHTEMPGAAQ